MLAETEGLEYPPQIGLKYLRYGRFWRFTENRCYANCCAKRYANQNKKKPRPDEPERGFQALRAELSGR